MKAQIDFGSGKPHRKRGRRADAYDTRLAVLTFIRQFIKIHVRPPTYREIMRAVGLHSTSAVAYHIEQLIKDGELKRRPGARGLEVVS